MKTHLIILTLAAASSVTFNSCRKDGGWPCIKAKGDIVKETRVVGNFSRVEMDLSGNVYLVQDTTISTPKVEVETNENVIDRIETEVKGGTLVIKDKRCINHLRTMNVFIATPDIESIYLNGSGDITSTREFNLDYINVAINGSGNIRFDVHANEVKAEINGSGNITMKGSTTDQNIEINGSGDVKNFDLNSVNCNIDINGSGNCEVSVSESLHVEIHGSGDVIYDGSPSQFFVNNQGSGSVSQR